MDDITFEVCSFEECLSRDPGLAATRREYAAKSAEQRRRAADYHYHGAIAGRMFNQALAGVGQAPFVEDHWPEGVLALAIDPLFAPALLTVGSIEHQLGRKEEAMRMFMTLTTLPPDEPDLHEIIDKAGDFLIDEQDFEGARDLYAAAASAHPEVATHPIGLCYCLGELGRHEEAVAMARRALELEPDDCGHLNDLGWSLFEAGHLDEAEATLRRAVEIAPDDDDLPEANLRIVLAERTRDDNGSRMARQGDRGAGERH